MWSFDFLCLVSNYFNLFKICSLYATCYPIVYRLLQINEGFSNLKYGKQLYVVKNVIKSISLAYLTCKTIFYVPMFLQFGDLDMDLVRWWGTLFVANDITALMVVPNLPQNTKNHHQMTFLLLNIVYICDANELEFIKLICIYTIFSYYAFLVNLYLGLRFLVIKNTTNLSTYKFINNFIDRLRVLAYYNYGMCLAINWTFHIYYLVSHFFQLSFYHLLYFLFLVPIIKDDLILLGWLKNKTHMG
jgi:hypothetical protein